MLYVANEDDAKVSFLDLAQGRVVRETPVGGEPEGMAASPDGKWVICTSEAASLVHFIDAATGELKDNQIVGSRPRDAKYTPDGKQLWVTSEQRATISVFDAATQKPVRVIDLKAGDPPPQVQAVGLAMTRAGDRVYVALGRGDHVAEIDPATYRVRRTFKVGHRNWGVALSPDETRLYAANGLSGDLSVVDLESGRTIRTLNLGGRPWGVVTTP
jgi:YVTN family beta-propeller protein